MRVRALFGVASLMAVAGMLWGSVAPARACTCVPVGPGDPRQAYADKADAIVLATVLELIPATEPFPGYEGRDFDALVAARRYEKGDGPSRMVVRDGAVCGFFDEAYVGRTFRLYLAVDGSYSTGWCSGSHETGTVAVGLDDASGDGSGEEAGFTADGEGRLSLGDRYHARGFRAVGVPGGGGVLVASFERLRMSGKFERTGSAVSG